MSKNNRKKVCTKPARPVNKSCFEKVMITLIIAGVVILMFINYALPVIKNSAKKVAAEKTVDMITKNAEKIAVENPQVAEVLESLTEEDKQVVSEIIENHMDSETVGEVMGYVTNGDKESLVKYAADNLTAEEISELMKLYGKYGE
ncbi:hypothetical protein [Butyrivibrio sp. YAB3001]|uniref:hypothetical protein n=1 Tax=Butyrivibrio sp. YAB3001 TaxID=1520812 RepID=UPI0008F687E1|nr:hypothetical protein [Butyrivibrio sp. YAB3001]SFC34876.1 hypothetical protein SAMN02910398_02057 [Butyrivibrio sp. YAB3001]